MMLADIVVQESRIHGRGLFTRAAIPCGEVVWFPCPRCGAWSPEEARAMKAGDVDWLDEFGYRTSDGGLLLPCSNAYLMNHSCEANVLDYGLDFGVAVRDIEAGEEVTCDFRTFTSDPSWSLDCRCGSPRCAGKIVPGDGLDPRLHADWTARLADALARLGAAPQPLRDAGLLGSAAFTDRIRGAERPRSASILRPGFLLDAKAVTP